MFNNVQTTNLSHRLLTVAIIFLLAMTYVQETYAYARRSMQHRGREANREAVRNKQEMRKRARKRAIELAERRAKKLRKKGVYEAVYNPRSKTAKITIRKSGLGIPKEIFKAVVKRWPDIKKFIVGSAAWDVSKTVIKKYGKDIAYFSIRQTRALSNKVVNSTIQTKIELNIPLTEFEELIRKHQRRQTHLRQTIRQTRLERINEKRAEKGLPPIKRNERTIIINGTPLRFEQRKGGKFVE